MESKLLLLVVIVATLALAVISAVVIKASSKRREDNSSYQVAKSLFTPAERSFLGVLERSIPEGYRVFGKVRVADVLTVVKGRDRASWQRNFNRISAKHFDFVICQSTDLSVACVIELNDSSHAEKGRVSRDAFIEKVCEASGLKLIQVPAKHAYSMEDLQKLVSSTLTTSKP